MNRQFRVQSVVYLLRQMPGWHALLLMSMLICGIPAAALAIDEPTVDAAADIAADEALVEEPVRDLETLAQALVGANYTDKELLIGDMAALDDPRVTPLLQTFLDGRLYYRKEDKRPVVVTDNDAGYLLNDAVTGAELGSVGRRDVQRVGINNALRIRLRSALALLGLSSPDADTRTRAAAEMIGNIGPDNRQMLEDVLAREKDGDVRELIETALVAADLDSGDATVRLQAINDAKGSLHPEIRQRLARLGEQSADKQVAKAANAALLSIQSRLDLYSLVETIFFGLSLGSVLLLAAIGLAITFGVMGVINMAHGELIMLGAYTTYVVQLLMPESLGWSLAVAIPTAFMVSALFGVAIERGVIRFLYGRPLETLLATFGISLVLQQLVRSIFSPLNRSVSTPDWMSGSLQVNAALSITYNRLYIIVFSLLVFVALLMVLKRTSLGLKVRAVAQNRSMAKAMGVRTEWVDAMTFGLGSGIAGVAGVALSQLTNVGPNLGQAYIIDSFMVVVFGGVGNLWGTLVGAMSLGVANKFLEPYSGAVLAKILVLVFIILFIQKRPRGLFPQQGRSAEN